MPPGTFTHTTTAATTPTATSSPAATAAGMNHRRFFSPLGGRIVGDGTAVAGDGADLLAALEKGISASARSLGVCGRSADFLARQRATKAASSGGVSGRRDSTG